MNNATDHRSSLGILFGLITAGAGAVVLVGWWLGIPILKSVWPGFVTMKANTAAGFVLAGVSLALAGGAVRSALGRRVSQVCAGATALLGLLTLGQYLFGLGFGIDQLLFREPAGAVGTFSPGRMAPTTAVNFFLLGCALVLAGFRRTLPAAQGLALLVGLLGLLPLMGYLYGAAMLVGIGHYTQMAVHTATLFILASIGVLFLHPAEGFMRTVTSRTISGWLLRSMMPFALGVPLVLGWLRIEGERHGCFESELGTAIMMVVLMSILTGLTWWAARALNRSDAARRQAEADLSEREECIRATLYGIYDGVIATDALGRVTRMNPVAEQLTGWSEAESLGRPLNAVFRIVNEETRAEVENTVERVLRDGAVVGLANHTALIARDGTERPIADSGAPIRSEQAGIVGVVLVFRDQTAERAAMKALERETDNLRTVMASAPVGLMMFDENEQVVLMNPAASRLFWRPLGGLEHKRCGDLLACVSRTRDPRGCGYSDVCQNCALFAAIKEVLATGQSAGIKEAEMSRESAQGPVACWLRFGVEPVMFRGRKHAVLFLDDITAFKRVEHDLAASETRYRRLFEAARDGVLILDADTGRIVDVNPFLVELLGFPREGFLGKHLWEIGPFKDIAASKVSFAELQAREYVRYESLPLETAGGQKIEVEFISNVYRADNLKVIQCNIRDITERKKKEAEIHRLLEQSDKGRLALLGMLEDQKWAEDALRKSRGELERRVLERTEELNQTKQAAEAANRAKSDFLASMSHELRTPLGAIIGFSEVLAERSFGDLNPKQAEYIDYILVSGRHLLALINDVLDLAKVEAGKMELEWSAFPIALLFDSSLVMVKEKCMKHGIALSVEIAAPVRELTIKGDVRKLKQIMFNLLSNAVKFTPAGGQIRVRAGLSEERETNLGGRAAPPADVSESEPVEGPPDKPAPSATLVISVSDTGIGIAPEHQEKIFDEFYQVEGGLKGKTPGTGLGLALVRRMVALHGGRVWVESAGEGQGSTFRFTLPLPTGEGTRGQEKEGETKTGP